VKFYLFLRTIYPRLSSWYPSLNYQVPQYIVPLPVQSAASVRVTELIVICTFVLVKVKLENFQQLI